MADTEQPPGSRDQKSGLGASFRNFYQPDRLLNANQAGAGGFGVLLGGVVMLVGYAFYASHSYLPAMFIWSLGMLIFKTGRQFGILLQYTVRSLLSEEHIVVKALNLKRAYEELSGITGSTHTVPGDNALTHLVWDQVQGHQSGARLTPKGEPLMSYSQLEAHISRLYVNNANEGYIYGAQTLEFVAAVMPLFGLVGPISEMTRVLESMGSGEGLRNLAPLVGAAMANTLYGAFFALVYKILASRFRQQAEALHFDQHNLMSLIRERISRL